MRGVARDEGRALMTEHVHERNEREMVITACRRTWDEHKVRHGSATQCRWYIRCTEGGPSVAKSLGCDAAKAVAMQQLVLRPVIG